MTHPIKWICDTDFRTIGLGNTWTATEDKVGQGPLGTDLQQRTIAELMFEEFAAPTASQQQTDFQCAQWSVLLPTLVLTPSQSSDLSAAVLFASNHPDAYFSGIVFDDNPGPFQNGGHEVPEPSSVALLGSGLVDLGALGKAQAEPLSRSTGRNRLLTTLRLSAPRTVGWQRTTTHFDLRTFLVGPTHVNTTSNRVQGC